MTVATGLLDPSGMLVRQRLRNVATRDEADRVASDYIALPDVELVHVWLQRDGWIVDVYSDVRGDGPSGIIVTRAFVASLSLSD